MYSLRPYQEACVERVLSDSGRPIECSPTGSGKSLIMAFVAKRGLENGERTAILTPRAEIFDQMHSSLSDVCGQRNIATLRAGHRWDQMKPIHIVSWPTLTARMGKSKAWLPDVDRVIVDEAHLCAAAKIMEVMEHYRHRAKVVGFTATPARQSGKGLGEYFTHINTVTTVRQLISEGYLAPCEYWGGRQADMKGVKIKQGDFDSVESSKRQVQLVGDVVDNWLRLARERHTIVFAVDIAHALALLDRFLEVGIVAAVLHSKMQPDDREDTVRRYKAGHIRVLVNVMIACLDEETEILTDSGWVTYDKITDSHKVANWDQGRIFFQEPLAIGIRDREPDERMVVLETKNRSIRVTENHRMLYRTTDDGLFKVCKAHELVDRIAKLPVCGVADAAEVQPDQEPVVFSGRRLVANSYVLRQQGLSAAEARQEAIRRIEQRNSLQYAQPQELTLDECAFIGFWIGDGSVTLQKSGSYIYSLAQSTRYAGIVEWVDRIVEAIGVDFKRRINGDKRADRMDMVSWCFGRGTGFGNQRRNGVYKYEPYLQKDGAALLRGLTVEQFEALIKGLWMADGAHGQAQQPIDDCWSIGSTNKKLLDLLQAIACCRGYRASVRPTNANFNRGHKRLYMLRISRRAVHHMTKYRLQFEPGWKAEKVWCVTSHSGFIVTRRHGTVTVMGNSYGFDAPSTDCIVMARPTKSIVLHLQMIGRGMRPFPGKQVCMVLDHSGNTRRLGMAEDEYGWTLESKQAAVSNKTAKEREKRVNELYECQSCSYQFTGRRDCPKCGAEKPMQRREVATVDADLVRIGKKTVQQLPKDFPTHEHFYRMLLGHAQERGYKSGWAAHKFKDKAGDYPPFGWNNLAPLPMSERVHNWILSQAIRYAKSRAKTGNGGTWAGR